MNRYRALNVKQGLCLVGWMVASWVLLPGSVQAQTDPTLPSGTYILSGVTVEGTEFIDPNSVTLLSGLRIGSTVEVPGNDLSKAVRNLWKQNIFSDISLKLDRVEGNQLFLTFVVKERPRISKYTFRGITKNQADDLRERIRFIRGQRFTEAKSRTAERIIKNYYAEKGFLNTEVDIETEPDENTPNGLVIIINVDKNKRVKVTDINFTGHQAFTAGQLQLRLKNTKERRFGRFWKRSKYIPALFQEDKQQMLAFMKSKGYRDANIVADTVIKDGERGVIINLDVFEGNQYYFGEIDWVGNFTYTTGYLDTLMGIEPGEVFNPDLLDRRLSLDPSGTDISSLYLDNGYLFFNATPVETAVRNDTIDLEIQISEGPRARYRNIILEGNDKTSDFVVLRQVRTLPGNYFSRSEIIRSQREIISLGYFSQENMNIVPMPNPEDGTVDIKYVVEEKPSDQVFFQGGWGGQIRDANGDLINNGIVLTLGLRLTNFSTRKMFQKGGWRPIPTGDGQQLNIQAQANGRFFQSYSLSFIEPWLGGRKPNSLGASVFYSIQDYRAFASGSYISIIGGGIDYGKRLNWPDDYFRSTTSFGYKHYNVQNGGALFGGYDTGEINIFSIKETIERNSTNAPIYPTSGSIFSVSLEMTPPYSLVNNIDYSELSYEERYRFLEFHKWKFQGQGFLRMFGNFVVMPRVMFGYLGLYSNEVGQSPFERFQLGGDGIANFQLDGREIIALRGYELPSIGDASDFNSAYVKYTLELRQPIALKPSATVWVHGFLEAGNAWSDYRNINPLFVYRSIGAGVRIFLPIFGLLGIDYGYALDQNLQANPSTRGNIHFMIGQQF